MAMNSFQAELQGLPQPAVPIGACCILTGLHLGLDAGQLMASDVVASVKLPAGLQTQHNL